MVFPVFALPAKPSGSVVREEVEQDGHFNDVDVPVVVKVVLGVVLVCASKAVEHHGHVKDVDDTVAVDVILVGAADVEDNAVIGISDDLAADRPRRLPESVCSVPASQGAGAL